MKGENESCSFQSNFIYLLNNFLPKHNSHYCRVTALKTVVYGRWYVCMHLLWVGNLGRNSGGRWSKQLGKLQSYQRYENLKPKLIKISLHQYNASPFCQNWVIRRISKWKTKKWGVLEGWHQETSYNSSCVIGNQCQESIKRRQGTEQLATVTKGDRVAHWK